MAFAPVSGRSRMPRKWVRAAKGLRSCTVFRTAKRDVRPGSRRLSPWRSQEALAINDKIQMADGFHRGRSWRSKASAEGCRLQSGRRLSPLERLFAVRGPRVQLFPAIYSWQGQCFHVTIDG
ncbi:Stress-response A/B barrel domain-containing protein [Psidium guajava]|nr:Stress-response A/B barrel domain-containing protein [Psidium guajava]